MTTLVRLNHNFLLYCKELGPPELWWFIAPTTDKSLINFKGNFEVAWLI
jgi:hypothetical protein